MGNRRSSPPLTTRFLALQSDASLTCFSQASKVPEWRASMQDEFTTSGIIVLLLYVDDILIIGSDVAALAY